MAERKLDNMETAVVKAEAKLFFDRYLGKGEYVDYPSFLVLRDKWKSQLDEVLINITAEFFEWFEGQEE